ncbi:hypothetical protein RHMOL_Rhmol05G0184500 [Rhododendron molle]|uniref:Uncharacterized protein n=1 Tax=Rhododendron molle TaxID=49168 RepID=A0ACC0NQM3_RHOML|nr:hypothetical protein RHMOL_Rhmol05G0184500 [Rhododendron molle]
MLRTFEPSDHASDGLDLISTTNDRESFIAKMRSEPSDANDSKVRSALHCTAPSPIPL